MPGLALILILVNLFTGSLTTTESQLGAVFNVFQGQTSPQDFAHQINLLIGPIRNPASDELELGSSAALVMDYDSGRILYSKSPRVRLPIASLTKLMTVLVVIDRFGQNLNQIVTVSDKAVATPGSRMYLQVGERLTVATLLKGALIESANDAAVALAEAVSGDVDSFVHLMNTKAQALGLTNTHFIDPVGFDDTNHYSTVEDLAKLTKIVLANPVLAGYVSTKSAIVRDISGSSKHTLTTTNQLLTQNKQITGVKTGTSDGAGESVIISAKGDSRQQIIIVLLNSPDRFGEAQKALDWTLASYTWIEPSE